MIVEPKNFSGEIVGGFFELAALLPLRPLKMTFAPGCKWLLLFWQLLPSIYMYGKCMARRWSMSGFVDTPTGGTRRKLG